jgi:hypothetical protein
MTPTRRAILVAAPLAAAGLALAACGNTAVPPTLTPSQLATDLQLIATGFSPLATALQGVAGFPATALATVQAVLPQIAADAQAVAAATAGAPLATVQDFVTLVEKVADTVLPLIPGAGAIYEVVLAAQALLPVIEAAVGITGVASLTATSAFTPAAARLRLARGL